MENDLIYRQAAIDAADSETVITNPDHYKSSEKFIKFMDDADIASFGNWQWANGFNTALAATTIQLKKLPSAQPEQRWISVSERLPEEEYVLISKKPTKLSGSKWCVTVAIRMADPRSGKIQWRDSGFGVIPDDKVLAWMPLPEPYEECKNG